MPRRIPKENDQEQNELAYNYILKTIRSHPEIESTLWYGALTLMLVKGFIDSGLSYEMFCQEWDNVKKHYRSWWED